MKILGILNITEDSFSDGGKFLAPEAALAQAQSLLKDGADILDIGAASSHPDARPVAAETEIARLSSVLPALKGAGASLSIDTFSLAVQRWALAQGIDYLNDIHGFPDATLYPALAASQAKLIVMHMVQPEGVAVRTDVPATEIFDRVIRFFESRLEALINAGVTRDRLILDPGMGQFVGTDPENSFILLRRLPDLKARFGLPLLVSVSRKGFLRRLVNRPPAESGPARLHGETLAAELLAAANGADYIRTHAPAPLRDGLKVLKAMGKHGNRL
jgi:dihydropteroate synthase type 2